MTGQDWLALSFIAIFGLTMITFVTVTSYRQLQRQDEIDGNRQLLSNARWLLAHGFTHATLIHCPECEAPVIVMPDDDSITCGRCSYGPATMPYQAGG